MGETISKLSADRPLDDPRLDRLGYSPFAKQLAKSIINLTPVEGIVLGIFGPWGTGKSTILNFVIKYLEGSTEEKKPIIIPFNPWWFSGQENLTRHFFGQIGAHITGANTRKFRKQIASFADAVSDIPVRGASGGKFIARLLKKSVPSEKKEIEGRLLETPRKLLIIIDDIDRLEANEIRQIFKLVKSVGNFPNVIYLLAFDKNVVAKALERSQGLPGESYLEKIVQVPFEIPSIDSAALHGLFFELLDQIIADVPGGEFDQLYLANIFHEGVAPFLQTPRDVVRLINTLSVTYPAVHGEVNPVDMVGIETLRVFCAPVYDATRRNAEAFAGAASDFGGHRESEQEQRQFYDTVIDELPEPNRQVAKKLLLRLFPKLHSIWENTHYGPNHLSDWRRKRRVCSPDHFHIYFRLALPAGAISNAEIRTALAKASSSEAFGRYLREFASQRRPDGSTRVSALLDRLEDYTEERIPEGHIESIITALFDIGDQLWLPEDLPRSILSVFDNETRIGRITWQLLRRLPEPERFRILEHAMSHGLSVSATAWQVGVMEQEQGRHTDDQPDPKKEWTVTTEHLDYLVAIALAKIRASAREGRLMKTPGLLGNLYRWRDWASEQEARDWVQDATKADDGLARFLEGCMGRTLSQSISDVVSRIRYRVRPDVVKQWLPLDELVNRIKRLAEDKNISENQRKAANLLLREMDLIAQGKDPERYMD